MSLPAIAWDHFLAAVILVLLTVVVSFFSFRFFSKLGKRIKMGKSRRQGRSGEDSCEKYLKRNRFTIVEKQPHREGVMHIDNRSYTFTVRPDFLVRKGRKEYLVEVKKGKTVSSPLVKEVRRQLLEYLVLYGKKNILFFDGNAGTLHKVVFPSVTKKRGPALLFLGGMAAGIVFCLLVYQFLL